MFSGTWKVVFRRGSDDDYDSDIEYEDDNAFGDSIDENMRKYEL